LIVRPGGDADPEEAPDDEEDEELMALLSLEVEGDVSLGNV
jgi:hypothetical protein